jgi:hypothetical protein
MPDVTVDLRDLEVLVDLLFECTTRAKAGRSILSIQQNVNLSAVQRYMELVDEADPKARSDEELRYRELIESLQSGSGVASCLSKFVRYDREKFERELHKRD